jgi:hypothetical protein
MEGVEKVYIGLCFLLISSITYFSISFRPPNLRSILNPCFSLRVRLNVYTHHLLYFIFLTLRGSSTCSYYETEGNKTDNT